MLIFRFFFFFRHYPGRPRSSKCSPAAALISELGDMSHSE
jgi:hypothetical protein